MIIIDKLFYLYKNLFVTAGSFSIIGRIRPSRVNTILNFYNFRKFSSTSLPPIAPLPNKIVVNSTFDNIVFINNQSILFLPPLHIDSYSPVKDNKAEKRNLLIPFYSNLFKVFDSLDKGLYRFDLYLYFESCLLMSVYTLDFNNKNCFNKVTGSFGYGRSISQEIKIEISQENRIEKVWAEEMRGLSGEIVKTTNSLRENKDFNILLNKEVLLVINKI